MPYGMKRGSRSPSRADESERPGGLRPPAGYGLVLTLLVRYWKQRGIRSARGLVAERCQLRLHQQLHDRFPVLPARPGGRCVRAPARGLQSQGASLHRPGNTGSGFPRQQSGSSHTGERCLSGLDQCRLVPHRLLRLSRKQRDLRGQAPWARIPSSPRSASPAVPSRPTSGRAQPL